MLTQRWSAVFSLLGGLNLAVALRQPYEYLVALQNFQDGWLNPGPVVASVEAPALASNVIGRVDVTTTFVGQELNTEYLYGFFLQVDNSNVTSLIGAPISQTIQTLLIEPPEVFVSVIVELNYSTINTILPLQLDLTFQFNDELKIQAYDIVIRRFPEAFKYLLPILAPQLSSELGQSYDPLTTNTSLLLSQKVASDHCPIAQRYCVGNDTQYISMEQCQDFLINEVPFGEVWEGGLNTGFCRYVHMNMVQYRPEVHCPHIGPTGGDMCINRDYNQIVNAFPYNHTLVALNYSITPGDLDGFSTASVKALVAEGMNLVYPTTVAFYPVPAMILLCFLYISSKAVEYALQRKSNCYREMSYKNQRNTITYILNTFWTTVALGLQLPSTATLGRVFVFNSIQCIKLTALLVSELYIWELIYRVEMRASLLAHHFCTLLAIFALFINLENSWHPNVVPAGTIWLFQATTEQSIFIRMAMYRLKYDRRRTQEILKFAAIQSLVVKLVFAIYLLWFWAAKLAKYHKVGTDVFFSVIVVVLLVGLMTTQAYGSWAVWCIARSLEKAGRDSAYEPALEMNHGVESVPRESMSDDGDEESLRTLAPTPPPKSLMGPSSYQSRSLKF